MSQEWASRYLQGICSLQCISGDFSLSKHWGPLLFVSVLKLSVLCSLQVCWHRKTFQETSLLAAHLTSLPPMLNTWRGPGQGSYPSGRLQQSDVASRSYLLVVATRPDLPVIGRPVAASGSPNNPHCAPYLCALYMCSRHLFHRTSHPGFRQLIAVGGLLCISCNVLSPSRKNAKFFCNCMGQKSHYFS